MVVAVEVAAEVVMAEVSMEKRESETETKPVAAAAVAGEEEEKEEEEEEECSKGSAPAQVSETAREPEMAIVAHQSRRSSVVYAVPVRSERPQPQKDSLSLTHAVPSSARLRGRVIPLAACSPTRS